MIAEILPSLNLPNNIKMETFSYIIPTKLENSINIGQIVEINFRNKKVQGIVLEIKKEESNNFKLKEITKIIQSDYRITQNQLDIINFISKTYFVSKSKALKTVIPELPKNKSKKAQQ